MTHPENAYQVWGIPDEPDRSVARLWDDDGYRWDRIHGGTDAEPSDHWESVTGEKALWPEVLRFHGPMTTRRPAPTPDEVREALGLPPVAGEPTP